MDHDAPVTRLWLRHDSLAFISLAGKGSYPSVDHADIGYQPIKLQGSGLSSSSFLAGHKVT